MLLSRIWGAWDRSLVLVKPETVIRWHRKGFRLYEISQAAVSKYMVRRRTPPSQNWRTFLESHAKGIVSVDSFAVPTATFRVLFVFVMLSHDRRRIVHFNVTTVPSAAWTGLQVVQPCPDPSRTRLHADTRYSGMTVGFATMP